jgi:hypothetical protein
MRGAESTKKDGRKDNISTKRIIDKVGLLRGRNGQEIEKKLKKIIIIIQLQLGWNPVAEVYNTYTATV